MKFQTRSGLVRSGFSFASMIWFAVEPQGAGFNAIAVPAGPASPPAKTVSSREMRYEPPPITRPTGPDEFAGLGAISTRSLTLRSLHVAARDGIRTCHPRRGADLDRAIEEERNLHIQKMRQAIQVHGAGAAAAAFDGLDFINGQAKALRHILDA
jgi:hypothetical protein